MKEFNQEKLKFAEEIVKPDNNFLDRAI